MAPASKFARTTERDSASRVDRSHPGRPHLHRPLEASFTACPRDQATRDVLEPDVHRAPADATVRRPHASCHRLLRSLDGYLALPRGCLTDVTSLVGELEIALDLHDERVEGATLELEFRGELNESQRCAARAALRCDVGVVCAPPGWGKTVLATHLIATRGRSTLVLVHRKPLLEQWTERLCEFLDITPKSIGRLGGGRRRLTQQLDIAMVQTLARSDNLHDLVRAYGHVVIDDATVTGRSGRNAYCRPSQRDTSQASQQHPTDVMVINRSSRCSAGRSVTRRRPTQFAQERLWSVG